MVTLNVKIMNVSEVTTENGQTVTVSLGLIYNADPASPPVGGVSINITGQEEEIAFYKTNAGAVLELPIDISTVSVVTQ